MTASTDPGHDSVAASRPVRQTDRRPDRYAVIGNPVEHSRSPFIHAAFALQTGQDMVYDRLLAPLDGFAATVRRFRAEGGRGLNVTVPFKIEAHALASSLSTRARDAGAANTLRFDGDARNGTIFGDNTDGIGLVRDLVRHGVALTGARVLLLGAGGAARGVLGPILDEGPVRVVLANRTLPRARELAARFAGPENLVEACAWDDLDRSFDVIINATSASLAGASLPLRAEVFAGARLAYDMMYGTRPTAFMEQALAHGAQCVADGLGMLIEQAAESFFVWRGVRPETGPVLSALRAMLMAGH